MFTSLTDILPGIPQISIADIGASAIDGDPPYMDLLMAEKCNLIGFEPDQQQFEVLQKLQSPGRRYLPYALGDGEMATLHVCEAPGMTSLLEPDTDVLQHLYGFMDWGRVRKKVRIPTRRLDDITELPSIDYLKMDVQGSELKILQHGTNVLKDVLVIQLEAQLVPFYKNQPLFAELDLFLREAGFYLHTFTPLVKRTLKPYPAVGSMYGGINQVFWTDAVYVRKFTHFADLSVESLLKIALIANDIYQSFDLAALALSSADRVARERWCDTYIIARTATS